MATVADYTSLPSGIFKHVGPCVKHANNELTRLQTTLTDAQDEICDMFEAAGSDVYGRRSYTRQITEAILKAQADSLYLIEQYGRAADARLMDKTNVLNVLNVDEPNVEKVVDAIIEDMAVGSASVKANVFSVGTVTAASGNVGNGSVLVGKVLDGVSQPCQRFRAQRRYLNVDSELAIAETIKIICVADGHGQVLQGYAPNRLIQPNFITGNELWYICGANPTSRRVTSNPMWGSGLGLDAEGSGPGPITYGVNVNLGTDLTMLVKNDDFEYWTVTDTPDDWTIDAGAATTNVKQATSTKLTGSSSLQFLGSGAADIRITQAISPQYLIGNKRYYLSFWTRGETGSTGTSTVQFTGTGYTASSSEKVSESAPTSTSWVHKGFYITMPSSIPSDWTLKIELTGTPATGKSVWYDDVNLQPVAWHGGLNFVIYNGDTPPTVGDYYTVPITQSTTALANTWAKRWWGVQFPSLTTGAETISEAFFA